MAFHPQKSGMKRNPRGMSPTSLRKASARRLNKRAKSFSKKGAGAGY